MSPITIYRPRGFGGGYDHRFIKPFQPATGAPPVDPNAGRREAHMSGLSFCGHARAAAGWELVAHGKTDVVAILPHAQGEGLDIKVEDE